jgi:sialate O-acetylesterase
MVVKLPPMKAGGPHTMEIKGQNTIVLNNILLGDVWVCSGQSNMPTTWDVTPNGTPRKSPRLIFLKSVSSMCPKKRTVAGPLADKPGLKWVAATTYLRT